MTECPVPGCSNNNLQLGNQFCSSCGVFIADTDRVRQYVSNWQGFQEDPKSIFHGSLGQEFIEDQAALIETTFELGAFQYGTIQGFRVSHPTIRFFRCWHCDMISEFDQAPLLPPERYAHSTLNDEYLLGRRPEYSMHDQKKATWQVLDRQLMAKQMNPPNLDWHMRTCPNNVNPDQWVQSFNYTRTEHEREVSILQAKASRAERELSLHPARPYASQHSPCPHCNHAFPFVLRPHGDNRYSVRPEKYLTEPKTVFEHWLWGDESPVHEFAALPPAQQVKKAIAYAMFECDVKVSMVFIHAMEKRFAYQWKLLDDSDVSPAMERWAERHQI